MTFTYDVEQALTANTFTRDGFTFSGWAKSTDSKIIYSNKGNVKADFHCENRNFFVRVLCFCGNLIYR